MNVTEQIDRGNVANQIQANIPHLRSRGAYVVAEYAGLHFVGCESFIGQGAFKRATAKLDELNASGTSTHAELLEPTVPEEIAPLVKHLDAVNSDHLAQRFGVAA